MTQIPKLLLLVVTATLLTMPAGAEAQEVVSLEEAVRLALLRDPAAVAATAGVEVALANRMQTRGSLLPSLFVNSGYTNSSNQRFDQATGQLVSESYTAQLSGSYEIFAGGRRLAELRVSGAELLAAESSQRAQRFTTVLQTTRAFYDAVAAREVTAVAEQRLVRARQQAEFAATRLELGTATRSDALRAELEVGNAELAVLEGVTALRTAELELGRRIGAAGLARPASGELPGAAPALPPVEELVVRAGRTAPAVVAAEATLRSRRAARLSSLTAYVPSVRATGGYDWFSFDFPPEQRSWNLRLTASMPLFNGLQREATVQRAAAAERVAQARASDAAAQVRVSVEAAALELATAERRVVISTRAVELAREDLRVQEERYQIGATTILELQASQLALADAEVATVRARHSLAMAVAQLEAVLGERIGGLDE
jgi:outer membrane protein